MTDVAGRLTEIFGRSSQEYHGAHAGALDIRIGELVDHLSAHRGLCPPRSGHVGSWDEIMSCRSGGTDFNEAICRGGYGYPLIYAFTRTETLQGAGDTVYRPGSIVRGGRRTSLELFSWDGARFVARSRSTSWFCPFVLTVHDGDRVPVAELHRRRLAESCPTARFEADDIVERWSSTAGPSLRALIALACSGRPGAVRLSDLVSHAATRDGIVTRSALELVDGRLTLEGHGFPDIDSVIDAALLPFLAVARPDEVLYSLASAPPVMPVLSHYLVMAWSGLWAPEHADRQRPSGEPAYHWGARAMAGWPPRRGGYLSERSGRRRMQRICRGLAEAHDDWEPLHLVLLPATIFMLCPSSADPRDAELLADLCGRLTSIDDSGDEAAEQLVSSWLVRHSEALSGYYRSRFAPSPPGDPVALRPCGSSVEVPGFRDLTMRQACLAVGQLHASIVGRSTA